MPPALEIRNPTGMTDFDAVVAGGGPNGLAAALKLAEAGWAVCLVEANDDVGGAVRTVESTLPGFRHDFGAGFFPLAGAAPAFTDRDLGRYGLRMRHAPIPAAHPFPGGEAVALGRSVEQTAASLTKVHARDGDAWAELDGTVGDATVLFLRATMERIPAVPLARLLARLGPSGAVDFARLVVSGATSIAERFESQQARAFLVGPAMHADMQPELPGTGIYALLLAMAGERFGNPVAEGGTGRISRAMADALQDAGGVVATGRPVRRILVEGGRVAGVEAGGDPITAGRAVIAALDPDLVVRMAGPDNFPSGAVTQVRRFRRGLGTCKVDWALDGPVPWAAEECCQAAVVHVGDSVEAMSKGAWEASYGLLPAWPTLILGQQSLADPSRAPAGKHTLWGYAHVPAAPVGDAARPGAQAVGWDQVADVFADRMEAGVEAHAPGFRDRVLARRVWTPVDLQAADASLVGGDITAGSFAIDQQLLFRPGPSWWRWGTPLKGLYLGGAGVPPGAGVHGACGDLAARQALADARRPARLTAAAAAGAGLLAALAARGRQPPR